MILAVEEWIPATPEVVWPHLADPDLMHAWMPGVAAARVSGGMPLQPGCEVVFTTRSRQHSSRVIACEPRRQLALRVRRGPVTATYRYKVQPRGEGSLVQLEAACAIRGAARLLVPLITLMVRRGDRRQLAALKQAVLG